MKYLYLQNNEMSEGVLDFLTNFNFNIDKAIIEKNNNALLFKYYNLGTYLFELNYIIKYNKIN